MHPCRGHVRLLASLPSGPPHQDNWRGDEDELPAAEVERALQGVGGGGGGGGGGGRRRLLLCERSPRGAEQQASEGQGGELLLLSLPGRRRLLGPGRRGAARPAHESSRPSGGDSAWGFSCDKATHSHRLVTRCVARRPQALGPACVKVASCMVSGADACQS